MGKYPEIERQGKSEQALREAFIMLNNTQETVTFEEIREFEQLSEETQ